MKLFNKICNIINKIYTYTGVALLFVISVACILQVFSRYVMGHAIQGTEEISRYSFIWMGFLGSSICVQNWSNANVSILNDLLKGKAKKWHSALLYILVIICASILFYQGIKCVGITGKQKSSMLRIPMSYVYAAIPVGAFGMIVSGLQRLLKLFFKSDDRGVKDE